MAAVSKPNRTVDHHMRTEPRYQRHRGLDAQPAVAVHTDGLVTTGLARLAIRGQKQPCRVPARSPLLLGRVGLVKVIPVAPQPFPAHGDRRMPGRQRALRGVEPIPQRGQAPGLGESLARVAIPATPPRSPAAPDLVVDRFEFGRAQRAACLKHLNRAAQIGHLSGKPAHPQLVLVFHRAGDSARPPRRRLFRQHPLTCARHAAWAL